MTKRLSPLTLRILAVNIFALIILGVGFLYAGKQQEELIAAELQALTAQAKLFAAALAEGGARKNLNDISQLATDLSTPLVRRFQEETDIRIRLFDTSGSLLVDSHKMVGAGGVVQIIPLDPPPQTLNFPDWITYWAQRALDILPGSLKFESYPRTFPSERVQSYPYATDSLRGTPHAHVWRSEDKQILLTASVPVQELKRVIGAVLLTKEGTSIRTAVHKLQMNVLIIFAVALGITILLSLYLSRTIALPIHKLAHAAETIRYGQDGLDKIPDYTKRRDEIGYLSGSLRQMTGELWDRIEANERFAADVSHEIKNPLTSLRSAVETAGRITDKNKKEKLMNIILHDVHRLDRLISDISAASRLDAELARTEMKPVDVYAMLETLIKGYMAPLDRVENKAHNERIKISKSSHKNATVMGIESRLVQVFQNLINNALTFSSPEKPVHIDVSDDVRGIIITVTDSGPGIPEARLESIFDRFYTERPENEDYGEHSGLGLNIAKKIILAHHGRITAKNRRDNHDKITGAEFTVVLPRAGV